MEGSLTITAPDDMHVHLRDGDMLKLVCRQTSATFRRALVMPNLTPPVRVGFDVASYRERIMAAHGTEREPFTPLMTFKVMPGMTPAEVQTCVAAGAVAGKLYPEGVTTNSQDGVRDVEASYPVFAELEKLNAVLCLHGETPGVFCMDREKAFLKDLKRIVETFPKLRVVLEHVTTGDAVRAVLEGPDTLAATITVHHLVTTLDDVVGGMLNPHNFCKPIAKRPEDMWALRHAVFDGSPKFFLGTDSAPHSVEAKHCASGCAGVFSAPCAMETLIEVFEDAEVNELCLEAFTSVNGARFYGLERNSEKVRYIRESWRVPDTLGGRVVPFRAGQEVRWRPDYDR
jgi:dihydroorotase